MLLSMLAKTASSEGMALLGLLSMTLMDLLKRTLPTEGVLQESQVVGGPKRGGDPSSIPRRRMSLLVELTGRPAMLLILDRCQHPMHGSQRMPLHLPKQRCSNCRLFWGNRLTAVVAGESGVVKRWVNSGCRKRR